MWRCQGILLICAFWCGYYAKFARGSAVPTAVQLGGAVVAAVEEETQQEEEQQQQLLQLQEDELTLWPFSRKNLDFAGEIERMLTEIEEGRGKFHKRRKMLKYLYPLIVGVLVAKTILIPLVLKSLTVLSATSFAMSKIALITAGFLALKWILAGSAGGEAKHLEIVHLPPPLKVYQQLNDAAWGDLSSGGSDLIGIKVGPEQQRHKYIPVGGLKDSLATNAASSDSATGHRHSPHSYESTYNGKPFL